MKFKIKCDCGETLKREWVFVKNTYFMIKCDNCGNQINGTFVNLKQLGDK